MKFKWVFIFCLLLSLTCNEALSQGKDIVEKRYVFVLDVTKSMCGFNGSPNILDKVTGNLMEAIENINDPNAEIYLSTFQETILNKWQVKADIDGKEKLIKKLKEIDCENLEITNTNILSAWKDIENNLDRNKMNIVFLLTDGEHNVDGKEKLLSRIKNWGNLSQDYPEGAYSFFVELTDAAIDEDIHKAVEPTKNIQIIHGIEFYVLRIKNSQQVVNTNEDNITFELSLSKNNWNKKFDNIPIRLKLDNENFKLGKETYKVGELPMSVNLIPKRSIEKIRKDLPPASRLSVDLSYNLTKHNQIKLLNNQIQIKINNKKEKVLYLETED